MYYLYNNTSRNIPQDIFGKFDKKNKPIKAFGGFLFFISVKQPAEGVSQEIYDISDELIKIPMPGQAESLNVAVAHGIIAFEAVRQRRQA